VPSVRAFLTGRSRTTVWVGHSQQFRVKMTCNPVGGYSVNQRIAIMGCIVLVYSLSEMIFGATMNSVALVSDGFHNLADAGGFGIALFASVAGGRMGGTSRWWEAVGATANSSLSLLLTLFAGIEAYKRLFVAPHIYEKPELTASYFFLAVIGIFLNGLGAVFLGGHGHSHGGLSCPSSHVEDPHQESGCGHAHGHGHGHGNGHQHGHAHSHSHSHSHEYPLDETSDHSLLYQASVPTLEGASLLHPSANKAEEEKDLNLKALWLHTALDAISSLLVLLSGLFTKYGGSSWASKADSVGGLLICLLVWATTVPVFVEAVKLLLGSSSRREEEPLVKNDVG